jgi:hypothetical protein
MNKVVIALSLLALSGCAVCDKHRVACAVAVGVVMACAGHIEVNSNRKPDVVLPSVGCDHGECR